MIIRKVTLPGALLCALFFVSVTATSCSAPLERVNSENGHAIKGFDPVAYFTTGGPVKGEESFAYEWNGAKWLFSSGENRDLFVKKPELYAPQYGGY